MMNNHFVEENHLLSFLLLQVLFYRFQLMMLYQQVERYPKDLLLLVKFLYTKLEKKQQQIFNFLEKEKLNSYFST
jgi:hypothetical protein